MKDLKDLFIAIGTRQKWIHKNLNNNNLLRTYFDASFQGVKRLLVLAFNGTTVNYDDNPINNTSNRVNRNNHR